MKILLERGANSNIPDNFGRTPLLLACSSYHKEIVQLLLDYGGDMKISDNHGDTPFLLSIFEIMKILMKNNSNINVCEKNDWKRFHKACFYGELEVVKHLLDSGVDFMKPNKNGKSPLQIAIGRLKYIYGRPNYIEIIKLIEREMVRKGF